MPASRGFENSHMDFHLIKFQAMTSNDFSSQGCFLYLQVSYERDFVGTFPDFSLEYE